MYIYIYIYIIYYIYNIHILSIIGTKYYCTNSICTYSIAIFTPQDF